ncbi:MAG: HAMP domain-containing histidine kinase [Peptostreptococcaceae bacterium]|jgi:histidine kinase|nr:HAMP domain-containing histidine kinase [Peptostreptococcaceae bacterium]
MKKNISIKQRLLISYIGMILIPSFLILGMNYLFRYVEVFGPNNIINDINPWEYMHNALEEQRLAARRVNKMFIDGEYKEDIVKDVDKNMNNMHLGLAIKKNDEYIYKPKEFDDFEYEKLPEFSSLDYKFMSNSNKNYGLSLQDDFIIDNDYYSAYFIVDIKGSKEVINAMQNKIMIIHLLILFFVSIILTYITYRSIRRPLNKLEEGINQIKKGNLNYKIQKINDDEIGKVSDTLEEMRIKLKKSFDLQKKYEENRKKLISNISHDLRTPIMSIKGYVEGIKDGIANSKEKKEKYINTIYEKAKDMEFMIEELFLFSRLDLKKEEFNFSKINIIEFLKYSVEELSFDVEKINGRINLNLEDSINKDIFVKADIQKLKRAIINIASNSIKYRDLNRELFINISLKNHKDYVEIQLKDNGIGISKENLKNVMDRFYRADESRNSEIKGHGLGLSICKNIINSHGGKIYIDSELNKGTKVSFTLKKEGM